MGGVSAFGYSGTIGHAVLRRGEGGATASGQAPWCALVLRRGAFGWRDEAAEGTNNLARLLAFSLVPVLGPAAYLVLRPDLPEERA